MSGYRRPVDDYARGAPQGRFSEPGVGTSSRTDSMRVVSTPSTELAFTNCAYCSHRDLEAFRFSGRNYGMALVNNSLVLNVQYPTLCCLDVASVACPIQALSLGSQFLRCVCLLMLSYCSFGHNSLVHLHFVTDPSWRLVSPSLLFLHSS